MRPRFIRSPARGQPCPGPVRARPGAVGSDARSSSSASRPGADGELARYPEDPRVLPAAREVDRSRQVRGDRQDDDGELATRCCASARRRIWRGSIGWSRSTGASPIRAGCPTARRRSWRPKASRSTCSTPPSTRPKSRTARRSSPSSIGWPPRTRRVREILDNSVVLMVPSQNPDGQHLVIDHWYKTKGTQLQPRLSGPVPQVRRPRRQSRLVHVHAEGNAHEHRAGAEQVQADHHARHAPAGPERLAHLRAAVHRSVRRQHPPAAGARDRRRSARRWRRRCSAEGKEGVAWLEGYDMWTPARQYMVYHGQPRILTEIARAATSPIRT